MGVLELNTKNSNKNHADVLVIGGGLVGSAVAFGIAETDARVIMLDEGDRAFRAARGNAGLVWYQGKGTGMRRYQEWSLEATQIWPEFAEKLHNLTGIDVSYRKSGGLCLCVGESELKARRNQFDQIRQEAAAHHYDGKVLDRKEVQELLPGVTLGDEVVGASYSVHDGHVNPLYLLKALHAGIKRFGGYNYPGYPVMTICKNGKEFIAQTPNGSFTAPKLVIAAGNGTGRLAAMAGMHIPVHPEKGQLLVTERTQPYLPLPCNRVRQTTEGNFLLGTSQEEAGFDVQTTSQVMQSMSSRVKKMFPVLARLRIVRTWASLRVMTPDGKPVYEASESYPGVFAIALHSGVTQAALHASKVAQWILTGEQPEGLDIFSSRRFHV